MTRNHYSFHTSWVLLCTKINKGVLAIGSQVGYTISLRIKLLVKGTTVAPQCSLCPNDNVIPW